MSPSPAFHLTRGPSRIVCLTEEPTEILYALGEQWRIVGISAYTERPPEAKADKPVVSAFIGGSVDKIVALAPELVIGFSDIQADLARELIAANLPVLIFNQRSLQEILDVILAVGRIVDAAERAEELVAGYVARLERAAASSAARVARPRVYFEEWDEPAICGIRWVSELIELAGGKDVFAARSRGKLAKERFVSIEEIADANPDVYLASWCGKPFDRAAALARTSESQGADEPPPLTRIAAARSGRIHEVPAEIILQPGPACLTDGLDRLQDLLAEPEG